MVKAVVNLAKPSLVVRLSISKKWSGYPCLDNLLKWGKWKEVNSDIDFGYMIGAVEEPERLQKFFAALKWDESSALRAEFGFMVQIFS